MVHRLLALLFVAALVPVSASKADSVSPAAERVVERTLRDNPDMWELCKGGEDTVRPAVTTVVVWFYLRGELGGSPREIGTEAGHEIGRRCIKKFGDG